MVTIIMVKKIMGPSSGRVILKNSCRLVAPSIFAAS